MMKMLYYHIDKY